MESIERIAITIDVKHLKICLLFCLIKEYIRAYVLSLNDI